MTIDWAAHYNPLYEAFGVSATLTLAENNVAYAGLTVIDKTQGVEVTLGGDVSMMTIKPACVVRTAELAANGIEFGKLGGSRIIFNGKTWRIENRLPRPSPAGEMSGELYLIVIEDVDNG
jgi:hypothetical protein